MEVHVRADRRLAEVWLSRQEQGDPSLREALESVYAQCREKKYTAAVYLSGTRDLEEETAALLRRSRRQSAEQAARRDRLGDPAR